MAMHTDAPPAYGRLAKLTWPEAQEVLATRPILLLPIGSTEAHGPHLPLDTDVRLSVALADRAAAAISREGFGAWVLPPISYGLTDYGSPFAGNVTIRPETLAALVIDICVSLTHPGARSEAIEGLVSGASQPSAPSSPGLPAAVVLVNSHLEYPHVKVLREACTRADALCPVPVVFADQTRRRWVGTLSEEFQSASCHAGSYETSLMMASAPGAVRRVGQSLPEVHADLAQAMREGKQTFVEAGAALAYCGAPAQASQAEGEAQYDALVTMVLTTALEAVGAR